MYSQKVNRYSKKLRKKGHYRFQKNCSELKPVRDAQTGFIHHPVNFPIEFRRLWFPEKQDGAVNTGKIGVMFESQKYIKPGTTVEIVIPLRNETEKFRGKVVLVRDHSDYYEIGLWMYHHDDASRVRIVEQICHIETYLQEKKYRDGPYSINHDRITEEWISKYAGSVPTL
ncbi:MAG: hypothetical protein ACE5GZ_13400 [Gammaproteobacteria bacterium]